MWGCVGGWSVIGGISVWLTYKKLKHGRKSPIAKNNISNLLIGICICLLLILFQSWLQIHRYLSSYSAFLFKPNHSQHNSKKASHLKVYGKAGITTI